MKKKILMILLASMMTMSASACGKEKTDGGDGQTQTTADEFGEDSTGDDSGSDSDGDAQAVSKADQIEFNVDDCVKLGDYKGLQVTLTGVYKVTDEDVQEYAQNMVEYYSQPVYKDTDKKVVEEGDTVNIDYVGKKDGVAFDGGTASGAHLTIGSHQFIDGFEEGLVGAKVGDTLDLDLTFPENYQSADLAGAAVVFTVTINKIVEEDTSVKQELTDEFVSTNFHCDTVEDYLAQIRSYLETSNSTKIRQAVIDKLLENCEVTIPDGLLDARVDDFVVQYTNQYCTDGTTLSDYLSKNYSITEDEFHSQVAAEMETTLKTELVLEAIVKAEGIKLDEDKYKEYVQQQMTNNNFATEEDFYKANGVNAESGEKYQRRYYTQNAALDQVIDSAKIKYDKK